MLRNIIAQNSRVCYQKQALNRSMNTIYSVRYQSADKSPEEQVKESQLSSKPIEGNLNKFKKFKKNDRNQPEDLKLKEDVKKVFKPTSFQTSVASFLVKYLGVNVDKVRSGPIAGSYYYKECSNQGLIYDDDVEMSKGCEFFYNDLKLPRTFSQWYQIHILHVWILFVRMRALPFDIGKSYQKKIVDRTFAELERKLKEEMNVRSGKYIDNYLKEFNSQLRGCIFAYDEGFYTDDYTLAKALWRNLFGGRKNVDFVHLEACVRYVRSQLYVLSKMSDRDFATGNFKFVPADQFVRPLTEEQYEELKKEVIAKYEKLDNDPNTKPIDKSKLRYDN